ncbi:Hypothetical predicted protein [Pelobates cultripes]|uniref:HAT C-terminal dimerisation domain-containing protein n=1 Tax=Pelobates cultripes TaxID=61616 RepID=A0AAD1WDV5_PELCU|nr:Hypothetical predicted protein [Pelobates cultripes]
MKASNKKSRDSASFSTQSETLLQQVVFAAETTSVNELAIVDMVTDVAEDADGVSISKEWSTGTITPYGKTKKDMLTSLRKKIHIHKISEAHVKAGDIQVVSRKEILQSNIAEQQKHKFASTTKKRPSHFFLDLLDLLKADAQSIEATLLACLSKFGFSNDFLAENWIGACSDGVADAVQEMGLFSEALQRVDITLLRAYQLINRSICAVEKMKDMPGKHLKEVMESLEKGNFKGVTINPECTKGQVRINLPQFYQSLVDNLRSRLFALTESNRPAASSQSGEFETLVSEIDILNSQSWPINVNSPWFEGEAKLEQLCKRFRLSYASICEGFRDYIDNGGAEIPENLKPVVTAVNSLPVTSGDCERGFSTMNLVMSPIRSGLGIERLSSLLFISLIGPPVHLWDPSPYVTKWLTTHRSADDTKSRKVDNLARQGQRYSSLWDIF